MKILSIPEVVEWSLREHGYEEYKDPISLWLMLLKLIFELVFTRIYESMKNKISIVLEII